MKKTIAILLVLAISLASVFAATDATLNLTTTVADQLDSKIVSGSTVPATPADFQTTSAQANQVFTADTLSADFSYAYMTNKTSAPSVTFTAGALKSGANVLKYSVAVAGAATTVDADGTAIDLGLTDTNVNSGLRVIGKAFTVSIDSADYAAAPAGTYAADIKVEVSAN